jgi:uncharacterized Zn-binding protein involved in type VI secretion
MGSPNVFINSLPAARVGDALICVGPPDTITQASPTVFMNGRPAARLGDKTAHGGVIVVGSPNTIIGNQGMGGVQGVVLRAAARSGAALCPV